MGQKDQQVRVPVATKPNNPSAIPKSHTVEGEDQLLKIL